jgi:eukaryotic-like serine/threonine-protein kinase
MKPERWQEASRILEIALEYDPDRRAAYLDEVCANDVEVRREVESLLAASEHARSLLDSPAMEMAAPLFVSESVDSLLGQSVGRYKIVTALGAGGMGEVYLAQDTRLGRQIALKLLPAFFTTDKDRLRRFEQEAHAASGLSHPNVCVIHEVGETEDGRHYIAMEYVEGVTLRSHMSGAQLKLTEALDVVIQVGSALAAAHASGVVHRDIKPENIMVRPDGIIKVLDFGLAKLTEKRQANSEVATRALVQTGTGNVMGTTTYMSPEQARGLAVDGRTDIWSLGVVLYEMLAGRAPFEGDTASDLIVAILKTEPPPLTFYAVEAPSELEHVTRKALQKEREARHQTVGELLNDLKEIKQELEFQAKLERSAQPAARDQANAAINSGQAELKTVQVETAHTEQDANAHSTSSAEYVISQINRHKTGVFITLGLFVACVGLAYAIYHFAVRAKPAVVHFQNIKITRPTNEGNVGNAAISPDGKYLAYSVLEHGKRSLWTKHLATDSRTQIVPPIEAEGLNPNTFTHDGSYVYYTRYDQQNPQGTLYQVPVLGGASKKILTDIACPISLSPDGKQFSFQRFEEAKENGLVVANADGTNERPLLRPRMPEFLNMAPAGWSPDGKMLAVGYGTQEGGDHTVVGIVSIADGTLKLIPTPRWVDIGSIVWFSDGSGLVLRVQEQWFGQWQIWQLSYPGGEARPITSDLNSYGGILTLTADGKALLAVQVERTSNIWIAPGGEASSARVVASGRSIQAGFGGLTWAPDGRVVYGNNIEGKKGIWIVNADGSDPKPFTDGTTFDRLPEVTADGRYLVLISTRRGPLNLWRMDIDGSNPKQLTDGLTGIGTFCITPDGRWVVYSPFNADLYHLTPNPYFGGGIWKVSIDGGGPIKLIEKPSAGYARVSPNGKLLAYHFIDEATKRSKITITSFDDDAPIKTFDMPVTGDIVFQWAFQWAHDGNALVYIDTRKGVSNLWSQPLDGSAPKQITDFKSDLIYRFAYSPDGKQLALARGNVSRDAVMISESK